MKKLLLLAVPLILILPSVSAKTTYIPKYWSYLKIVQQKGDSVFVQNILNELELKSVDESFRITIVHEDLTSDKIKSIKRAKAAAGWSVVAAALAAVHVGVDAVYYKNSLLTYLEMNRLENSVILSRILHEEASAEQQLTIEYFIDNLSEEELMVSDLERGLTWYILPHTSMQFNQSNPGIEHLRISDIHQTNIQYADIIAANNANKEDIEWEDDECWIVAKKLYLRNGEIVKKWYHINKLTYERIEMTEGEKKAFKKEPKNNP